MLKSFIFALNVAWKNSKQNRVRIFFMFTNSILYGASLFFGPYFLSQLVEKISNNNFEKISSIFILFFSFSLFIIISKLIYRLFFEVFCDEIVPLNIEQYFFFKLYKMPFVWHLNNSTGYNASAVKKISRGIAEILFYIFFHFLPYMITLILFFIYSFNISGFLLLYILLLLFFVMVFIVVTYKTRLKLLKKCILAGVDFDKNYYDLLSNIKTLKKLYIKKFPNEKINSKKDFLLEKEADILRFNALQRLALDITTFLMFAVSIGYYTWQTIGGINSLGIIVVLSSMKPIFDKFLNNYMTFYRKTAQNKADLDLLRTVFDENINKFGDKNIRSFNKLEFKNTYYIYKSDDRLFEHRVDNLEIKSGEKIGIIGTSGSGKTTFLNLLSRNIIPKTGEILINNINYTDISENFFEDNFVYISQEVELLDMSFKDNILLGKSVSDKKFKEIVKLADLEELLYDRLGGNENEILGERGTKVSAGEKQRINIARAFAMDKKIIILDEITANLDRKTSNNIRENLRKIFEDKTVIAISHEVSFMKYMDRMVVFEDGKIIKQY